MRKSLMVVLLCAFVAGPVIAQEQAPLVATKGKMLVTANGTRLGPIYKVLADGSAQVIIDGKIATIPAASLSLSNGQLTTSLTKSEVVRT